MYTYVYTNICIYIYVNLYASTQVLYTANIRLTAIGRACFIMVQNWVAHPKLAIVTWGCGGRANPQAANTSPWSGFSPGGYRTCSEVLKPNGPTFLLKPQSPIPSEAPVGFYQAQSVSLKWVAAFLRASEVSEPSSGSSMGYTASCCRTIPSA